ncbi:uncharacterized protein LOC131228815 [Magnolia sinica]|uniref:uncharacterized protein LOC131228815 n=1 Tax=Magnolia sinica TaxID=86752 RepID=UPI0026598BBC|nr:uncharacterized protein LOC131228815 [Magnolia sinica]
MRCTSQERVPLVIFLLQGEAQNWWPSISRSVERDFVWTWKDFVDNFNQKFFPEHVWEQRALEFKTLVQGDITMSQYEARFVALSRFATYLVDDERGKACRFVNSLHPALRSRVVGHLLTTFAEVVHRALVYEEDWATYQRSRDQGGDRKRKTHSGDSRFVTAPIDRVSDRSGARYRAYLGGPILDDTNVVVGAIGAIG